MQHTCCPKRIGVAFSGPWADFLHHATFRKEIHLNEWGAMPITERERLIEADALSWGNVNYLAHCARWCSWASSQETRE
ncbi:hypothetical protein [Bradyrhizobium sp. USDA 223]|uniref:hypothetical protein n=1 Tax=Bradyrhizobium sp. USDA 223 TaxID=3156306 RepID=UPI003834FABD